MTFNILNSHFIKIWLILDILSMLGKFVFRRKDKLLLLNIFYTAWLEFTLIIMRHVLRILKVLSSIIGGVVNNFIILIEIVYFYLVQVVVG